MRLSMGAIEGTMGQCNQWLHEGHKPVKQTKAKCCKELCDEPKGGGQRRLYTKSMNCDARLA